MTILMLWKEYANSVRRRIILSTGLRRKPICSQSTVRNMNTKNTVPTIYTLANLCRAGHDISEFFGDADNLSDKETLFLPAIAASVRNGRRH